MAPRTKAAEAPARRTSKAAPPAQPAAVSKPRKTKPAAPPPEPPKPPARKVATPRKKPEQVVMLTGFEPAAHRVPLTQDQLDLGLRATATPGIYINQAGVLVDSDGVMVDYAGVKSADDARFERILGTPADSPAKLLKAVALDPQQTLATRVDAAKAAAPYFDRKKPIGIDGGSDGVPVNILHTHKIQSMSKEELDQFERMLALAGPEVLGDNDAQHQA